MTDTILRDRLFNQLTSLDFNRNRITPSVVPIAKVGVPYSQQINTPGSEGTVTYEIIGGALPAGLTLSSSGLLSGTPTASGVFGFTIQSTDTDSPPEMAARTFYLSVEQAVLILSPSTLSVALMGVPYSEALSTSGGTAPYTYSIT